MLDQLRYARPGRCTGVQTPVELEAMFLRGLGILFPTPMLSAYSRSRLLATTRSIVSLHFRLCPAPLLFVCPSLDFLASHCHLLSPLYSSFDFLDC